MKCPVCQRTLENERWARCASCRLIWVKEIQVLPLDGTAPWPRDSRTVRFRWSPGAIVSWFVTLPFGALGAFAALLSLQDVVRGTHWSGWAQAVVAVPLGGMVAWLSLRGVLRLLVHLVAPDTVELKEGAALVRVREEHWLRSSVRFDDGAITSVRLCAAQGERALVFLLHRDGPHLLLTELPTDEARSLVLRLTA